MTLRRVQLHGQPGFTNVEDGATRGATLGATLFLADGTVLTLQGLANALGELPAATPAPAPGGVIRTPSVTVWTLIQQIPPNILEAAALTGNGLIVRQADGNWLVRELEGVAGRTVVTNGGGEAGNPAIDLAELADDGTGALLMFTRDAYGRVRGTRPPGAVDLGHASVVTAEFTLSALRAVQWTPGGASYPSLFTEAEADQVFGITVTAATVGNPITVQHSGVIEEPTWTWSEGIIWCGANGVLTQAIPSDAFLPYWILPVGRAIGATAMVVDIGTPIHRIP